MSSPGDKRSHKELASSSSSSELKPYYPSANSISSAADASDFADEGLTDSMLSSSKKKKGERKEFEAKLLRSNAENQELPDPRAEDIESKYSAFAALSRDQGITIMHELVQSIELWDTGARETKTAVGEEIPSFKISRCWKIETSPSRKSALLHLSHNSKGYCQVGVQGTLKDKGFPDKRFALSHLIFWYFKKIVFDPTSSEDDESNERWEVSHLCHNNSCANPEHLIAERVSSNKDRNGCAGFGRCMCPGCTIKEPHRVLKCRHKPPCLAPSWPMSDIENRAATLNQRFEDGE